MRKEPQRGWIVFSDGNIVKVKFTKGVWMVWVDNRWGFSLAMLRYDYHIYHNYWHAYATSLKRKQKQK